MSRRIENTGKIQLQPSALLVFLLVSQAKRAAVNSDIPNEELSKCPKAADYSLLGADGFPARLSHGGPVIPDAPLPIGKEAMETGAAL